MERNLPGACELLQRTKSILIVEEKSGDHHRAMKLIMLVAVIATLFLGACANLRGKREVEVVVPPHSNTVHDQFPSTGGRKTPDGQ